jgi:hypothetical protein
VALVVELGPAEHRCDSTAKKHGVEEDEAANGGVRVLAEHHERDKPDGRTTQVELLGGVVCHRDADNAEEGVESSHEGVVDLLGIFLARFELK